MSLKNNNLREQRGFIVLLLVLLLFLGSAAWFGTVAQMQPHLMETQIKENKLKELQRVKEKMLTFAVMQPEIYVNHPNGDIPGVGYFPCPDIPDAVSGDLDGFPNNGSDSVTACGGGAEFVTGRVPIWATNQRFNFIENTEESERFWYSVDARYVTDNSDYVIDSQTWRFPVSNLIDDNGTDDNGRLTLDGRTNIVMVLAYSGEVIDEGSDTNTFLELENDDGNANFISSPENSASYQPTVSATFSDDVFNDIVVSITWEEWRAAVLSRVSTDINPENEIPDLCTTPPTWFEDCSYQGAGAPVSSVVDDRFSCVFDATFTDNLFGQNWRDYFGC